MSLEVIKHEPAGKADAAIIWLHGLGASGNDFVPMTEHLKFANAQVRFLFPHAPQMPVTINQGMVMPAWYDITDMSIDRQIDSEQLRESASKVHTMIDEQVAQGIDSKRIIIAGFSQGGAVGYEAALTYPKPLAGLMAHSTYFATADDIQISEANAQLPILVQHGTQDPVVPEVLGQKACATLKDKGFSVTYQTYPMPHSLCLEQVQDMQKWLDERF
ncbi:carboxylesterase [Idiomarina sp. X4]|uniref:alpha/beta hydrolase n=1 Tax=Idiomarina sp. X4 TaxID=2055892 RepID=UPI000C290311|nr:dienelactone hydrolase family protein [Idiomarina sp. X4]ATZ73150.1 carboxylesterase [Idiomarina sp. X4]